MKLKDFYFISIKKFAKSKSFNATKTTLTSIVARLFNSSLNLISLPLTVNYLGNYEYGNWAIISSYAIFFAFADFGIGKGLVNRIASYGTDELIKIKIDLSSSLLIVFILQVLLTILLISSYFLSSNYFPNLNINFKYSIYIIAITAIFSLPLSIIQGLLNGLQKGYIFNLSILASNVLTFLLLLLIIKFKLSIVWLTACYFISPLIAGYFISINFFRNNFSLIPDLKLGEIRTGLHIIKEGSVFFVILIFSILGTSIDAIIINNYATKNDITIYSIVQKFFSLILIMQYFFTPYWPVLTNAIVQRDFAWIKTSFRKIKIYSTIISVVVPIFILLSLNFFVKLFFKTEIIIPFLLSFGLMLYAINNSIAEQNMPIMMTKYLYKKLLYLTVISGIASIILKIIFIKLYGFEFIGYASAISYLCFFTIPCFVYSKNLILNLQKYE